MKNRISGQKADLPHLLRPHLEAMLESIAEGVLEISSGRIVYANAAALTIFGASRAELLGANPLSLFDDEIGHRIAEMLKAESGCPLPAGGPVALRDSLVTIRIIPTPDSDSNKIMLITDVTRHSQMELELQHAHKMEAIGTIASGIAHNFRNTLAGILINSQVIQMSRQNDEELLKIIERINSSVQRGSHLVDRLLEFSYKQIKMESRLVDLVALIQTTHQLIKESFDKRISIHVDLPASLPVMGDHSGLSTVLMNLCNNAGNAMPEGGKLSIKARIEDCSAVVVIADTGLGMDARTLEKCFDPFFTTKEVGKGTGLGLSTAYGIVKNHNGTIRVKSRPGIGTVFTLVFPLVLPAKEREKSAPEENPDTETVSGKGRKVLIVDDEIDFLKALAQLLNSLDYQAAYALSGPEAIAKYRSWQPEVVLMDINMPEMDGITCAKRIVEFDPEAKIVIMSGYDENGRYGMKETEKKMFKGYLTKPIGFNELSLFLDRLQI